MCGKCYETSMEFVPEGAFLYKLFISSCVTYVDGITHSLLINRVKVMHILQQLDPAGVKQRKKKRLKRRIYRNKVWCQSFLFTLFF